MGFPGGSDSKGSAWNAGDLSLIPGLGTSPREENGNPLQYSCLENRMDGGVWWAIVHGVTKSWMRLGPSCPKQDCQSSLHLVRPLSCGVWDLVPWLGIKLGPLYWEQGVLTTGLPGKCPKSTLFNNIEHLLLEIQSTVSSFLLPAAKRCPDFWRVRRCPNQHLSTKCCPNRHKVTCPLLRVPLFLPNYVVLARWSFAPEEATWFADCLSTLPGRLPLPISVASGHLPDETHVLAGLLLLILFVFLLNFFCFL